MRKVKLTKVEVDKLREYVGLLPSDLWASYEAVIDAYESWQIWELIRRATCVCCGVQYVRQLKNVEQANEIADKICQLIYDMAMEYKDGEGKC